MNIRKKQVGDYKKMAKRTKVALIYDFDGTLSTTDMQNYALIPEFGMEPDDFWYEANKWGRDHFADQVTGSMYYFVKKAEELNIKLTRENMAEAGRKIKYFPGVEGWFDRINEYGKKLDLDIEHYIISAGYEEILYGCKIKKYFKDIFGCSFAFNEEGKPVWPARVINYSTKTQYLSKINKGLGKLEDRAVNEFMPDDKRRIPFTRMIYFGDGSTDIPSMKLTKERKGNAIAVYNPNGSNKATALKLLRDGRVNFALPADYREDKQIDKVVKTILEKLAKERDLDILKAKEEKKKLLAE